MLFGNIFWFIVLDLEDILYCKPLNPESQELFAFEWNDPETSVKPSFWMALPQGFKNTIFRELSVQFSSVTQLCPTLCNPMDCSTPGFPVHNQLLELAQTHVYRVGDAIQPSCPLSPPSPPAFNLSQHQGLFQ